MSEVKDPAIKLFGKTIQLPSNDDVSVDLGSERSSEQNLSCSNNEKSETASDSKLEDGSSSTIFTDPSNNELAKSSTGDNQTMPNSETNNQSPSPKPSQKEDQSETGSSSQDTNKPPLKKPDKILPCPRCNSMDTKFCYFNNYNVNQPRHFCKNCQRYWTAGGTMRNVPVGAGRRKSKNSSHHRHIIIPETANGMLYPALRPNGSVLAFGSDAPLCESMASALNIAENSNSSNTNTKSAEMGVAHEKQEPTSNNFHGFTPQVPCFPAPPWPSPWNPAQWNATMQAPPFLPSGYPVSIYTTPPPPYWGCGVPGSWSMPWMQRPSGSADHSSTSSSPNSPLGKHSRDGNVLTPKTLRIDDPNEAAKSSIWATLGIKNEKAVDSINSGGLFRGFKSKGGDEMSSAADTSIVLQANPAALSRSLTFHESAQ